MSNQEHFAKLLDGAAAWRQWRASNPDVIPDLSGVILNGMNLSAYNFSNCNLASAQFERTNLSGADFSNADLSNANFAQANLSGAIFSGAKTERANFSTESVTAPVALRDHGTVRKPESLVTASEDRYGALQLLGNAFGIIGWIIGILSVIIGGFMVLAGIIAPTSTYAGGQQMATFLIGLRVLISGVVSTMFCLFLREVSQILIDIALNNGPSENR